MFLQEPHGVTWQKTPFFMITASSLMSIASTDTKNSVALSPPANYTNEATAAAGEVSADFLRIEVLRGQRKSRYFLIQVAPQLSSRG
jgi:hypothetical protein